MGRPWFSTGHHLSADGTELLLDVTCWCERKVLRLPAELVLRGQTRSCDYLICKPPTPEVAHVRSA